MSKRFGGEEGTTALERASFEVSEGEFVALVGQSGCGKTTLLKIIAGLQAPSGGSVTIGDDLVTGPRKDVGFVFQSPVLLPWKSVLANVLLPVDVRRLDRDDFVYRARELLEASGIGEFASHYPHELSGGMQQRVAICRALLLNPAVLLMDEPFGALDAMTRDAMNEEVYSLWRSTQRSVVLVTHSIPEAVGLASKVIVMSRRPGSVERVMDFGIPLEETVRERMRSPAYADAVASLRNWFLPEGVASAD